VKTSDFSEQFKIKIKGLIKMAKTKNMKQEIKILKKQLKKNFVKKDGYKIMEHIADGHVSSVFLAQKDYKDYVLKILYPHFIPWNFMYWVAFQDKHGYLDDNATRTAFYRRKTANRLSKSFDSNIEILDAIELSKDFKDKAFYMSFIKHKSAETLEEKEYVLKKTKKLTDFFNEIGMPSWSFNPDYPFFKKRSQNLRLNKEKLIIIDYESGVLTPGKDKEMDLDPVDFESVGGYIKENKQNLIDFLGTKEYKILENSFEKCKYYTRLWHSSEKRILPKIRSQKELQKTIDDLVNKGILTENEAVKLNKDSSLTKYTLYQLTVHLAISMAVSSWNPGIPTGLFPRDAWTLGNNIYYRIKGNKEKAKIHNWKVLALSSVPIPPINYFGYLIPLKQMNENNSLVYGEHITRIIKNKSLKNYLNEKGRITKSLIKKTIVPKNKRQFYEKS